MRNIIKKWQPEDFPSPQHVLCLLKEIWDVDDEQIAFTKSIMHNMGDDDPEFWCCVARIFNKLEEYQLSQFAYYIAYDLNPNHTQLIGALLYTFHQLNYHEATKELYEEWLKDDLFNLSALEKLGNSCFINGDYYLAVVYYQRFLELRPNDPIKKQLLKEAFSKLMTHNDLTTKLLNSLTHDFIKT